MIVRSLNSLRRVCLFVHLFGLSRNAICREWLSKGNEAEPASVVIWFRFVPFRVMFMPASNERRQEILD